MYRKSLCLKLFAMDVEKSERRYTRIDTKKISSDPQLQQRQKTEFATGYTTDG
jgi:hypothetical protein